MELLSGYVKLEACMCVLNMREPGDCVCVLNCFIPADARRLVSREPRGTQRRGAFIFLTVRLLTEWEGCDNGRSHQSNKDNTHFTISHLSPQNVAVQRTRSSVSCGGVCVSIPVKVREERETQKLPEQVRTSSWWSHFQRAFVGLLKASD